MKDGEGDEDGLGGPLGELLSELPKIPADAPREAVHARVLPIATAESAELVFACWRDPGGPRALHVALQTRVEGSLCGELSRTAADLAETPSALTGLRFFLFADVADADAAVRAFGLSRCAVRDTPTQAALARLRHEADAFGEVIADAPPAVFSAKIAQTALSVQVEAALVDATDDVWGEKPGAPCARLHKAVTAAGGPSFEPNLAGIETVERSLFSNDADALRWVGPLTFQALCDLVALTIAGDVGRRVDWAEAAVDEHGVAPPPMLRIDGSIHVPVALEVLRWCVMPRRPDEDIPPLAEWVSDSFG